MDEAVYWTRERNRLAGHQDIVQSIRFSPALITTLQGHQGEVNTVRFSVDGKWLVSASSDRKILVWNLSELSLKEWLEEGCSQVRNYLHQSEQSHHLYLC